MGWYSNYWIHVKTPKKFGVGELRKQIESVKNAAVFLDCKEEDVDEVCEICWLQPKVVSDGLEFSGQRKRGGYEFLRLFVAYIKFTLGLDNIQEIRGRYDGEDWYAEMNLGFPKDKEYFYQNPTYTEYLRKQRLAKKAKRKQRARRNKKLAKQKMKTDRQRAKARH